MALSRRVVSWNLFQASKRSMPVELRSTKRKSGVRQSRPESARNHEESKETCPIHASAGLERDTAEVQLVQSPG